MAISATNREYIIMSVSSYQQMDEYLKINRQPMATLIFEEYISENKKEVLLALNVDMVEKANKRSTVYDPHMGDVLYASVSSYLLDKPTEYTHYICSPDHVERNGQFDSQEFAVRSQNKWDVGFSELNQTDWNLSPRERELIASYRALNAEKQKLSVDTLRFWSQQHHI
jgi:hypothetical protein